MTLHGIRIGVTAHRKGRGLVAALERRGAEVLHGPTLAGDAPVPVARSSPTPREVVDVPDEIGHRLAAVSRAGHA